MNNDASAISEGVLVVDTMAYHLCFDGLGNRNLLVYDISGVDTC